MSKVPEILWTERSLKNAKEISNWILLKFSQKEVDHFIQLLRDFEKVVTQFPEMFPESKKKGNLRKAVLHKNLSFYYVPSESKIVIIALFDNRQRD